MLAKRRMINAKGLMINTPSNFNRYQNDLYHKGTPGGQKI